MSLSVTERAIHLINFMFNGKNVPKEVKQYALQKTKTSEFQFYHPNFLRYGAKHAPNLLKILFLSELKKRHDKDFQNK